MRFVLRFALAIALVACAPDKELYPAPPGCEGDLCNSPPVTGGTIGKDGGAGGDSSGTGGAPATIEQTGTVHLLASPSFRDTATSSYPGSATIHAISVAKGTSATTPYGSTTGTLFDFAAIPSGATWLLVEDTSGGAGGVLSTFSYAELPVLPSIVLPVVDKGTLDGVASSLPSVAATGVSTQAAQVILFVSKGGAPFAGAKVSGGSGNAQIAYDAGAGYSDSATSTGPNGTAILFNASLAGKATLQVTDTATAKTWSFDVQTGPGSATLAAIELL